MRIREEAKKQSIFLLDPRCEIEAVLFDRDGVLVNSVAAHREAWNAALGEKKLPALDPWSYSLMLGRTSQDILNGCRDLQRIPVPFSSRVELIGNKERFLSLRWS